VERYFQIALMITSIALIASIVLQSKGVGLGGLTGADLGSNITARRGIEKTMFRITIVLAILFIALVLGTIMVAQ
jgi:preprotein translocase subunit SecG